EAVEAAAPATPFPFSTVTVVERRGNKGRAAAFVSAGEEVACLDVAARAPWSIGLARSAAAAITSASSSRVAIPAATTAMVRHGWREADDNACSTGSIGFAAAGLDPSLALPQQQRRRSRPSK